MIKKYEEENMSNILIPRLRTITQCLNELKKIDSETCVSQWYIRQLCKTNQIKYIIAGKNKILVNLDNLIGYLNQTYIEEKNEYTT